MSDAEPTTGQGLLRLIGSWDGPGTSPGWPSVEQFIDPDWDPEVREDVADHLRTGGRLSAAAAGCSLCRLCGVDNGSMEFLDSAYIWPEGLAHCVRDHEVRLPEEFVHHVMSEQERFHSQHVDTQWWRQQGR